MNISEFERTKPTKTMAAINSLIKEMSEFDQFNHSVNPDWVKVQLLNIKNLLKNGE